VLDRQPLPHLLHAGGTESCLTPPITEEEEEGEVEEGQDPEEDSGRYMGVLVQALSRLGRVGDALEVRGVAGVWLADIGHI